MTTTEPTAPADRDAHTPPGAHELDAHRFDGDLEALARGSRRWAQAPLKERAAIIESLVATVDAAADAWVEAAISAKSLDPASPLVGEEWMSGPYCTVSAITTLGSTLRALAKKTSPIATKQLGRAPGGRVSVPVLPASRYESLLLNGFRAEVWLRPGVTEAEARARAGLGSLRDRDADGDTDADGDGDGDRERERGGVGLVLGAGNITAIPVLDVLYELVASNRASILKLNPVMDPLLEPFSAALAPLIDFGVVRIVTGDGAAGSLLAHDPRVSHVHITGSSATHDAVVYGPGAEGRERKAAGTPLLDKPITSELGGVSPIIVLPGMWTRRDLRFQAEHVATMRLHNGGYNCIAGQTVIVSRDWPQREAFLDELRRALDLAPSRDAWYPGSDSRVEAAAQAYPRAERLGRHSERLLIDVRAGDDADALECTEYFSPVLGVVEIAGSGQAYLDEAVRVANDDLLGTLGANLIAQPSDIASLGDGFERALEALRYGTIAVNAWTGVGFFAAAAPWGAFPGNTVDDVQSGIGVVHNALLLADTERVVVRGPFRPFPFSALHGEMALLPKPPWFVSARSAATTGRLLARFAARPARHRIPAILVAAFRA